MSGIEIPILNGIFNVIDKLIPDREAAAKMKLQTLEMQQRGEFKEIDSAVALALGQMEVNKAEANSPSLFKGGWRPGTGWVCVAALAFNYLVHPMLAWYSLAQQIPVPPQLDMYELMGLLTGMLGLGVLRHRERLSGKA